ncbi:MAG: MmcQ/YjbR family DNA-binding protein [Rhodobacteraceae bacterium]|nr:MmcQ/YjbR family DNA-binding protein [Paracoccaceae bacterium]
MARDRINAICSQFPGAEKSDPWGGGHDAWKIGGKMFACIGAKLPGVSVKCPDVETAELLIETGRARKAPYFHKSWVNLGWETPEDELVHRLAVAYDEIRAKLPKKLQSTWPHRDG